MVCLSPWSNNKQFPSLIYRNFFFQEVDIKNEKQKKIVLIKMKVISFAISHWNFIKMLESEFLFRCVWKLFDFNWSFLHAKRQKKLILSMIFSPLKIYAPLSSADWNNSKIKHHTNHPVFKKKSESPGKFENLSGF